MLTLDDRHDGTLLNGRGTLETISVDTCKIVNFHSIEYDFIVKCTSKELGLQVHGIERVDGLVIVGFDLTCQKNVSFCSYRVDSEVYGAVCLLWRRENLPSGISSSPLSVEAMIAIGFDRISRSQALPGI